MKNIFDISVTSKTLQLISTLFFVLLQLNFVSTKPYAVIASSSISTGANTALQNRIFYANGMNETTLPECEYLSVCNKIDVYDKPWVEKQCNCPSHTPVCSMSTSSNDGHTIMDKTRIYKTCEPVRKLPYCRNFHDFTWVLTTDGENLIKQTIKCICPKESVAYMVQRQAYAMDDDKVGFKFSFACSPRTRGLCERKEPCRLFTVKRKSNSTISDVNTSALCQCPRGFVCPSHHTDPSVIPGKFYPENMLRTFSGYCV